MWVLFPGPSDPTLPSNASPSGMWARSCWVTILEPLFLQEQNQSTSKVWVSGEDSLLSPYPDSGFKAILFSTMKWTKNRRKWGGKSRMSLMCHIPLSVLRSVPAVNMREVYFSAKNFLYPCIQEVPRKFMEICIRKNHAWIIAFFVLFCSTKMNLSFASIFHQFLKVSS